MISRSTILLGLATAVLVPSLAVAEPTVGPPIQGHGGNGLGNRNRVLNDIELTQITRADEIAQPFVATLNKARTELLKASLTLPINQSELAKQTQAVAAAELALASNRADTYAKLKTQLKATEGPRLEVLKNALNSPTAGGSLGGRGGRGGGAAAAAPGAAAAAPGAAAAGAGRGAAAPAATPAGRGN